MRVLRRGSRARVLGAAVLLGAVALPLAPVSAEPEGSAASSAGGAGRAGPQVGFGRCQDEALVAAEAECATVPVPLDHGSPHGATIDVAVSRLRAADPARRRGVLLVNPGGPGAPGLTYPLDLRRALGEVADQYDLIGFDPRFVGASSPITCGPTRFSDTFRSPGLDRAGFRESAELAADFARRCHERNAALLPHGGTADVARDVDVIRSVLGEERISYYGVSWGTHLGAVYSELFPHRVDRMVLDSSTGGLDRRALRDQGPAAEAALDEWAAWAAARHDRYHLGTDAAAVRDTVERLIAHVARHPVTLDVDGRTHVVDDHTLPLLLQRWLNHEDDDASLAEAVRALADAAAGHPITPSPALVARLALFDAEDPMLENGLAAIWANVCADGSWPAGAHRYWPEVQRSRRTQPVFGPVANHVRPCAFWPEAGKPPVEIGNAVPLLMVQAERDNATTLADARRLHERLTGSRLVTADVRAHGVYGRGVLDTYTPIPCIDRTVDAYLADGTLPPRDTSCG